MGGRIGVPLLLFYFPTLEHSAFWTNCALKTLIIREMKIRYTWSWRRNALRLYSQFYNHYYDHVYSLFPSFGGARGGLIRNYFVHLPFELNDNMRETV